MITRRHLLQLAGSSVLIRCVNPDAVQTSDIALQTTHPLETIPADAKRFPISVLAGDATATGIVIVSRFLGKGAVQLRIWEELPAGRRVWYTGTVDPDIDGFIYVEAEDLGADRAYSYAFIVNDDEARSNVGHFRTAWADDEKKPLTFAGTACTHQRRWPWPVLAQASTLDLAFFVHNGDHVYADDGVTRNEYRAIYEASYKQAGMRLLHQAFTFYGTWDDHEFDQNFDPETFSPQRFAAAAGSYFEHTPVRRNNGRLWRSFKWGQTAEIFMLDCRSERKPSTRHTADAQYISREQMDWLKDGLKNSSAQFKFIINSVPIANFDGLWDVETYDRWQGYETQRDELLDFIVNETAGVWFLSGDFHLGAVGYVEKKGKYSSVREILWGPGGTTINVLYHTLPDKQWDHVVSECNVTMLTCDPDTNTLRIRFVGAQGNDLLDVTYPNS